MNKLKPLILLVIAILVTIPLSAQEDTGLVKAQRKMEAALAIISQQYVETLDDDKLVEDAINGVLKELDPHSVYIPPKKVKSENRKLASEFEGIGIYFNILNDTIIVVSPISGGPSEKLGIMAGDKIVEIDSEQVAGVGISNKGVRDRLLGEAGTEVEVGIQRKGVGKLIHYTIERDKIPLYSIDASYMASPTTGYIKVNRFASSTADEFRKSLKELEEDGMDNLILDLTGNGGGYLYSAFELADEFLEWGKMIVYTQGENSPKRPLRASSRGNFEKGKLVILIDEGSASASEIVTGAVQDWDRGLVIGRRSFGKGLVQKPYKLPDNSEIRLTIAKYYTPTGRCIQKPYSENKQEYYRETFNRFEHGELMHPDSVNLPDSLKYFTPNERVVYGGGGIMPDIFIPLDTSQNSDYLREISRKGIMNEFALTYVDDNRDWLRSNFSDVGEFKVGFDINDVLDEFHQFVDDEGVEKDLEGIEKSKRLLTHQLKALLARNLWDVSAYYEVFNHYRPDYRKALEVMQDEAAFSDLHVQK